MGWIEIKPISLWYYFIFGGSTT